MLVIGGFELVVFANGLVVAMIVATLEAYDCDGISREAKCEATLFQKS